MKLIPPQKALPTKCIKLKKRDGEAKQILIAMYENKNISIKTIPKNISVVTNGNNKHGSNIDTSKRCKKYVRQ